MISPNHALRRGLELIDGHIGDCGKAARAFAAETGAVDVSTLREPYRIEGKKTLGWSWRAAALDLPDAIVYPTGGGTGLIGMWKHFRSCATAAGCRRPAADVYVQAAGARRLSKLRGRRRALRALPSPRPWPRGCACRDRWVTV